MRYTSIDELAQYEFHDAELRSIELNDKNMVWVARDVNATTENSQNDHPTDMCIKQATLEFTSVEIVSIVFCAFERRDAQGVLIDHSGPRPADPKEWETILRESLDSYCYIYARYGEDAPKKNIRKQITTFTIEGGAGAFDLTFEYDRAIVTWDEYEGKAWYEEEQWKKRKDG